MREELLEYYERELTYLRQMGAEFAGKYPRVASRLLLEPDRCEDPHVERLLEGFAFLAARVHLRIDDDFPELTASLLNIIYPYYLRPIPAITVVECLLDPAQGKNTSSVEVPAGTPMVTKNTVDGLPCRFRTAYDVELWPFSVCEAEWRPPERLQNPLRMNGAAAVLRVRMKCVPDVSFKGLPISTLRFHLAGDASVTHTLYELLSANCMAVLIRDPRDPSRTIEVAAENLRPAGFEQDERLLPYERRSLDGYRLLQEYFVFPEKFLFFDLSGLEVLGELDLQQDVELLFVVSRFERPDRQQALELGVNARTFRLGCTPIINLFRHTAESILLTQKKHEYPVVPDARHRERMEIFSIDEVIATNPKTRQSITLEPVYSYRHNTRDSNDAVYWNAVRRSNELGERVPSTMYISVVDLDGRVTDPDSDVITVRSTCTNFDLPSRLPFGLAGGDFEAVGFPAVKTVTALRRPTPSYDPPHARGQLWRLVSHLSLNYLSLSEDGLPALQEILRLHNFSDSSYLENQIGGIQKLSSKGHFALVSSIYGLTPARGTRVEVEFEEQQFAGGGVYLFASVLERFLGNYASVNSFCQLVAHTSLRKEVMHEWPPRSGNQALI